MSVDVEENDLYMLFQHHSYPAPHHCLASSSFLALLHLHRELDTDPHPLQYLSSSLGCEPDPLDDTPESEQALLDDSLSVVDLVLAM